MIMSRRALYLLSLGLAALLILPWGVVQPRALDDLRNVVFDAFQRLAPRAYDPGAPVRVVAIDEESLKVYGQWPWPRARLAALVDRLRELGAASIAFDLIFAEPDRLSARRLPEAIEDARLRARVTQILAGVVDGDELFAQALSRANTTLGVALAGQGAAPVAAKSGFATAGDDPAPFLVEFPAMVAPLPELARAARGLGATNWLPDHDQIVRRAPLLLRAGEALFPSLALEALRIAQDASTIIVRSSNASGETAFGKQTGVNAIKVGDFEIATGAWADIRPRYSYWSAGRVLSARAILEGGVERNEIEGRIVFVGARAAALGDVRSTPLEAVTPGVEIHAQIVESIVSGELLSRPDWAPGAEFVTATLCFFFLAAAIYFASPLVSAGVTALAIFALFAGSFHLFNAKALLIDPAYPSLAIAGVYVFGAVALWRAESTARRQVRSAFGKFVSPAVVDALAEHPERLVLGGETRELTVLQSDLRDFASFSEGLDARELTQFMNAYLTPMTDAILERDGTIDKYMGDAILAFWNAPLDVVDHPRKAVEASLAMRAALECLNNERMRKAKIAGRAHRPAAMGLGLHLGPCSVGNMGSIRRFDYSILGDTVNVAARLEGVSKMLRTDIVCSRAVRDAAPDFAWLDIGDVRLLGKAGVTRIFALVGDVERARDENYIRWRAEHDSMRAKFELARFGEAAECAERLASSCPLSWRELYVVLKQRYLALAAERLPEDWSPVWNLTSK
ncbi:MAG: adenylate/guanylate cyclase domain-containing protein [Methylocystis sp.]|nr:adenylate/guanylate cyclase domain-containing protein [Methylocystis sp.]